nr:hypothetical protein [Planctomycetota bacterium]
MPAKTDRIRFVCEHCDYRARIPAKYDGQTIACPNCKKPSIAQADQGAATGDTVEIRKDGGDAPPADDKFRFVCADCNYRARIPVKYSGMAIKCPGCGAAQMAEAITEESSSTGGTVEIRKVDLTGGGDRFLFQCGDCGYRARLPSKYHGEDIKCPG